MRASRARGERFALEKCARRFRGSLRILVAGVALAALALAPAGQSATSGLVAAFSFDEGSGSTVNDASGNGNNGTVAKATWATGKYGKALSFNGSSARVTIPDSSSLHLSTAMTLEAWVDPTTTTAAWRDVIYKGNDNYYLEGTSDSKGTPGAGGTFGHTYGTTAITKNAWTFLAVTYDRTAIRLYVNGTQVSSLAATGAIATSTNPLTIGSDSIYGQYFSGLIDNVRIYNTALTQAQLQTDMTTPVAPPAPDTTAPSAPGTLTANAVNASRVDLTWGAATDNVTVTGYHVERCQGAGCSNFAEIGTSAITTYSDTTAAAGTSYSYRVRANDAALNLGPYSNITTATTPALDTQAPTSPTGLTVTGSTTTGITIAWAASFDNVGVTGYDVYNGSSIAGTTSIFTSYTVSGLTCGTSYVLAVDAFDAAGNKSNETSLTTSTAPCADTQAPTAPTGLTATFVSASEIDLSWTASTDNVGVTAYRVLRGGTQIGAPVTTTYTDSPLTASTTYGYAVEAVDAAGNVSAPSAELDVTTAPAPPGPAYPLKASANGRYLVDQNNSPFLMVGDAPQSLLGNLSEADWSTYFTDRQTQGFNTVWVNLLCANYTFCNADGTTYDGIKPFTSGTDPSSYDLSTPNPIYFQRVDDMLNLAAAHNLVVALDPIETGSWLTTLENNGPTKAFNYGVYLGNRYKSFPNIIWLFGNDFQNWGDSTDANLVLQVMQGIHSVDTNHLQTMEGPFDSSSSLDNSTFASQIGLNAAYTYYPTYDEVLHAYGQSPTVPVFLVEANYEFENDTGNDPSTPQVLRQQEYWTMTSGATGQLYGNYYSVRFVAGWQSNLDTTGAAQLGYETQLLKSLPWYLFVPDQNHTVLTAGYGTYSAGGAVHTNDYATAARASDGSTVMVYMPTSRTVTIDMSQLGGAVTARWFDPTNGRFTAISGSPFANSGSMQFTPPGANAEGSGDWVLLLQGPDTQAPSPPTDLTGTPLSANRVDLSWTASTDNVAVTGYEISDDGVQIATTTGTRYSDSGLSPDTTHSYSVQAVDASGNVSNASNTVVVATPDPDTAPPSVPTSLQASGVTGQSATITWAASTDNLGVAGYRVFRNGVQVADTAGLSYSDNGLAPSTTYQYTVAAYDFSGNVSAQSDALPVTTAAVPVANPAFVQLAEKNANSSSSTATTNAFSASTTTGDTIIVRAWYNSNTQSVTGMSDTAGDTYSLAVGPTTGTGMLAGWRQEIWYAKNVTGRTGVTVTASFSGTFSGEKSLTAHEYSGLDPVAPLDAKSAGSSASVNVGTGAATTTYAKELIFGAALFASSGTSGSGFTQRSSIAGNASEDRIVSTTGTYSATFSNAAQASIVQVATFRAAGQ